MVKNEVYCDRCLKPIEHLESIQCSTCVKELLNIIKDLRDIIKTKEAELNAYVIENEQQRRDIIYYKQKEKITWVI